MIKKKDGFIGMLYAVAMIAIMNPFFFWNGYRGGIFSASGIPVLKIVYVLSIISGIIYIATQNCIERDLVKIVYFLFLDAVIILLICGARFLNTSEINILTLLNITLIGLFVLFPTKTKAKIYETSKVLFVVTVIPGIVYSLFAFINIDLSFETLNASSEIKQNTYVTYLHFPFAVQLSKTYDMVGNINRFRLCGIYDEPGRVGTIAAMYLSTEKFQIKKDWKNLTLLIAGVLSLSLAFFLMIGIGVIYKMLQEKKMKYAIAMIAIFSLFFIFLNINFTNAAISSFQNRFKITTSGLAGYNRTNEVFDNYFSLFLKESSLFTLLFGNGEGTIYKLATSINLGEASSYKCIIYDIGFAGIVLYISWILAYGGYFVKKNKAVFGFVFLNVAMFILVLFQRPSIFNPSYLLITLSGIANYYLLYEKVGNKSDNTYNERRTY